jgi:hypothetical protein
MMDLSLSLRGDRGTDPTRKTVIRSVKTIQAIVRLLAVAQRLRPWLSRQRAEQSVVTQNPLLSPNRSSTGQRTIVNGSNSPQHGGVAMRSITATCSLVVSAAMFAFAQPSGEQTTIQTQVIGSFNGYQWTIPTAVNNQGLIVGYAQPTGTTAGVDAFIWSDRAGFQRLATDAVATDVNARGDVTGYRYECSTFPGGAVCRPNGFIWNERSGFVELDDLIPNAINNKGDVAGQCPAGQTLAACAIIDGVRTQWICEADDCGQIATAINARGEVVGYRATPGFEEAMLFPRRGDPVSLGEQTAEDINDAGVVAGRAPSPVWPSNATLWTPRGVIQAPSLSTTVASSVNSRGEAAGVRFGSGDGNAAFYWDGRSDVLVFLAPLASYSEATDINDRGEIIGVISTANFRLQLVMWKVR